MPLPIIAAALAGKVGTSAASLVLNKISGKTTPTGGKRRRRRGLTARERADIQFVASTIGKTAAANYINLLPRR